MLGVPGPGIRVIDDEGNNVSAGERQRRLRHQRYNRATAP